MGDSQFTPRGDNDDDGTSDGDDDEGNYFQDDKKWQILR